MDQIVIFSVAFVVSLIVMSVFFEYWQSRKRGMDHEDSVNESVIAGGFLSGSAVFGYVVAAIV